MSLVRGIGLSLYNEWTWKRDRGAVGGLYGKGMHDFILRELEVGFRVASAEDSEYCGFGPLIDYMFMEDMKNSNDSV